MNYLAHALLHLDRPYFVAGTSVPDWLSVLNRKVRTRSKNALAFLELETDHDAREVALGIAQHHADDDWFHGQLPFVETSMRFSVSLRAELPGDEGFRPSFLGHILVELLLDSLIMEDNPDSIARYYAVMESIDCQLVERTVSSIATFSSSKIPPADGLAFLIPHFAKERFLYDYSDNAKLLHRLNQVMGRVRLPLLPDSLLPWLESARSDVRQIWKSLLPTAERPA